jgi:hypothetical protein
MDHYFLSRRLKRFRDKCQRSFQRQLTQRHNPQRKNSRKAVAAFRKKPYKGVVRVEEIINAKCQNTIRSLNKNKWPDISAFVRECTKSFLSLIQKGETGACGDSVTHEQTGY